MWDLIVSVPDHCLCFYSSNDEYPVGTIYCVFCFVFSLFILLVHTAEANTGPAMLCIWPVFYIHV